MIATPLCANHRPLYPINCPVCGTFLGAFYRDGLTLRAYNRRCTARCEEMWSFAHLKRRWREFPAEWRAIEIATTMLEERVREKQKSAVAAPGTVQNI